MTESETLPIESIGWLFISKYYSTYTTEFEKLFGFYDKNAALLHDEFPDSAAKIKKVHRANGTDAIKKHFALSSGAEKNKIVVERADFQQSVDNSILIVVCGLWKRGTSDLLQFVQTFVLTAKEKTVYDVSNDMLKFLDFAEEYEPKDVVDVVEEASNGEANGEVEETADVEEEEAAEQVEVEETPVHAEAEADVESSLAEAPANEEQLEADGSEDPSEPAPKPTWANLAAMQPKFPVAKAPTASSPVAVKNATAPAAPVAKKTTPPTQVPQAVNGKYRKEEWYPIYIRNVEVDEEELKSALIKQFGDIKYFKKNARAALCDFRSKEDQQKALEAKEIVIRGNVISLEPRLHKTFNKPEYKKDKKPVKKNTGVKPKS